MGELDEKAYEREGLFQGLKGEAREARLRLLTDLSRDGVELEELKEAGRAGRLALVPVERALAGDGPRYTAAEVAEKAGVELEVLIRSRSALGVPETDLEARNLTDEDIDAARRLGLLLAAGLPEEEVLQVARTIGIATAQVAQSNRELIVRNLVGEQDAEDEVAQRLAFAAANLMPLAGPILTYGLRIHLISQVAEDVIEAAGLPAAADLRGTEMSVCFADLVGFTKLGERLPLEELGRVAVRLGELASEVAGGPGRLVKQIGDAVMMVSTQPGALVEAALSLSEAAGEEGQDFPDLRIGMDHGQVLGRSGDFYGPAVNRASRITAIARPRSVLASAEAGEQLRKEAEGKTDEEPFSYSYAGERPLKGISDRVRLYRLRRVPINP